MFASSDPPISSTLQGIVFKKSQGNYFVHADGRTVTCAISSRLRKVLVYPTAAPTSLHHRVKEVKDIQTVDPVAVGDVVQFTDGGHDTGLITEVLPRKNELVRRSAVPMPGAHAREQVIVANVDQVIAVYPAGQPAKRQWMLDQYLAAAEASNLPAHICLTKADLADEAYMREEIELYGRIGYPVVATSAVTGQGLAECKEALRGRVSVLVGKSGVGKTSLLNALQPGLGLRVKAVNQHTAEGKHATTHLEMFDLDIGGSVVDTPGLREFKLWAVNSADLAQLFPEMRPYLGQCKFGADCTHDHEPGCAVKAAVEAGAISPRRYQSYLRMRSSEGRGGLT